MATGDPTGSDLIVGTTDGDTLSASPTPELREVTFSSSVALLSGVKYAIVIRTLNAGASSVIEVHGVSLGGDPYANGIHVPSTNGGSTWGIQIDTADIYFVTKASGDSKDSHTGNENLVMIISQGVDIWEAQTFTTTSAYTISSVVLSMARFLSPGTVTVSIRQVEGETYFTPPVPSGLNTIATVRRLVSAANSKIWYESI
ncbi:hypothetical protein LCGC14_1080070 [marine sediment metagenome]|uniref:Uncharacterized protein n=1 Tax=marine sediment metagenome TaxID=412755 RepID=A0A0F9MK92_9ZZZZ